MGHSKRPNTTDRSRQHFDYHWFAYYLGQHNKERKLKGHHLRDGPAFQELSVALQERGGRYGSIVRNGPSTAEEYDRNRAIMSNLVRGIGTPLVEEVLEYHPVDESFLQRGLTLVVTTRLPMNDLQREEKVRVQSSFTSLEQKIIRICRPYVSVCSRSRVRLSQPLADQLAPGFDDRADISFQSYNHSSYRQLSTSDPGAKSRNPPAGQRTAAYMLQLPRVPALNGADLLVVWGMSGTPTLAFAHLLRNDLSYLLDRYGFSMIEMVEPPTPTGPEEPPSWDLLDFARELEIHVLLEGVLLDAKAQKPRKPMYRTASPARPSKRPRSEREPHVWKAMSATRTGSDA